MEDKSLEQQVSEDLAELEAENGAGFAKQLTDLECRLSRALAELEALKRVQHSLINDMVVFQRRLDRLDPSFNQRNCPKCGQKIRSAGGKCSVCR